MSKIGKVIWRILKLPVFLGIFCALFILMIYSPFYSQWVVRGLNHFVSFEVNEVAAKSQQLAALSDMDSLEPGSDLWIARQAYLKVLKDHMITQNAQNLIVIQARYQILQKQIEEQNLLQEQQKEKLKLQPQTIELAQDAAIPTMDELLEFKATKHEALMQRYVVFLNEYPIKERKDIPIDDAIYQDIAFIQQQDLQTQQFERKPYAIVVLGGGLTLDENERDIVVNEYTRLRLERTLEIRQQYDLPILLSGVEAPYMQKWLKARGVDANLLENRSMNTCENSRFSSLLLQKKGGAPTVILVTDQYHMPRTRRLFALNGIETLPIEAPMPTALSAWKPSQQNYDHSRRANYEMLATLRDVMLGSSDCREVP